MGISTHILDIATGRPAKQVPVTLSIEKDGSWLNIVVTTTDQDGRCKQLLSDSFDFSSGTYRIHFDTDAYYVTQGLHGLYPFVEITFTVTNPMQHYHIPLLLTANGYTTYRGS